MEISLDVLIESIALSGAACKAFAKMLAFQVGYESSKHVLKKLWDRIFRPPEGYQSSLANPPILYDFLKHVKKEVWRACFSKRNIHINKLYPCNLGEKGLNHIIFDDTTEGIISVLKDCWPLTLSMAYEESEGKISDTLTSYENLDTFYNKSREVMAESKEKEVVLFRHNIFDIIREDYSPILKALEHGNKVNVIISGTPKNLHECAAAELSFLSDYLVAQKCLLEMEHFTYPNSVKLNCLSNYAETLFSQIVLLDIMKRGQGNFTVSLNDSQPTLRGQIIGGETFFIKFPKQAPEYLGEGFSSSSTALTNKILVEMNDLKLTDFSTFKELRSHIQCSAEYTQDFLDRNVNQESISLAAMDSEEKRALEKILNTASSSAVAPLWFGENELEKAHQGIMKAIMGNKLKTFAMYNSWKKYEGVKSNFTGDFEEFLRTSENFSIKKRKMKGSETEICIFPPKDDGY